MAAACHDDGVGVAVFPELTLSGYSIEDIVLQDTLLDAVEDALLDRRGVRRAHAGARRRRAAAAIATGSTTPRWSSTAAGCSASCRSRTCRRTGSSTRRRQLARRRRRARRRSASGRDARRPVRSRPAVRGRRTSPAWSCTSRSARTCGSRSRRAPRPRWPGRRCWRTSPAARSPSGGPRTASLLCRSASSRCLAAYVYAAAGDGESTTDLAWDGQTMIYENGVLLAETERFPTTASDAVADVDLDLLRAERARMGTFDDNRRHHRTRAEPFRTIEFHARPADRRHRAPARGRAVPVRAGRPRPPAPRTATRPTTSRSRGSSSGCAPSATRRSSSGSRAASTRPTP